MMGGQASWLLPSALLALALGLCSTRRAVRTDRARAALLLWGGWLVVSGLVFSFGSGVIHTYYTVALAPAIAALIAIGGQLLWSRRASPGARAITVAALLITAGWSWVLLDRTPSWEPWLRTLIVIAAVGCAGGLLAATIARSLPRRLAVAVAALGLVACLAGPVAYAAQTVTTAHTGSIPSAGPAGAVGGGAGGIGGARALPPGAGTAGPGNRRSIGTTRSSARSFTPTSRAGGGPGQTTVSSTLREALQADAHRYRWVAATTGSQSAASLQLATGGEPVMAIGGFNNEGGNLTLRQFEHYVARGEIHYYLASGAGAGPAAGGTGSGASAITTWVQAHFKTVTVGGQTLYDLTQP